MKHINLGALEVSRIGLGTMGMSTAYTGAGSDDAESIRTIHRALELGVTLIDTAEVYGPFINEELVGQAISGRREEVVLATKFGMISHTGGGPGIPDSSPSKHPHCPRGVPRRGSVWTTSTCTTSTGSTRRCPSRTPWAALAELVAEGKIRPHRALRGRPRHHPPSPRRPPDHRSAVRVLVVDPGPRDQDAARLRELGIGFVAYSPLGRGMLTGKVRSIDDLADSDFRKTNPRFAERTSSTT